MHHALRLWRRQQWHQRSDRWILSPCDLHLSDKRHTKPKHKSKTQVWGTWQFDKTLLLPPHPSTAKMFIHRLGIRVLTWACHIVWAIDVPGLQTNGLSSSIWFVLLELLSQVDNEKPTWALIAVSEWLLFCALVNVGCCKTSVNQHVSRLIKQPSTATLQHQHHSDPAVTSASDVVLTPSSFCSLNTWTSQVNHKGSQLVQQHSTPPYLSSTSSSPSYLADRNNPN